MVLRKPQRETQLKDTELAVGALERPDPLDLEDIDNEPTVLDLDEPEADEISSSDPASERCIICGHERGGDCGPPDVPGGGGRRRQA